LAAPLGRGHSVEYFYYWLWPRPRGYGVKVFTVISVLMCSAGICIAQSNGCVEKPLNQNLSPNYFPDGSADSQIWLSEVACDGLENQLSECRSKWRPTNCLHKEDVGCRCYETTTRVMTGMHLDELSTILSTSRLNTSRESSEDSQGMFGKLLTVDIWFDHYRNLI